MTIVKFVSTTNFSQWQLAKAEEIRRLIETTVNQPPFQDGVLAATFLDVRLERSDGSVVTALTNRQILDVILAGVEQGTNPDQTIGLRVALYDAWFGSAIGSTDEHGVIHTRGKFFNNLGPAELAGHWMHEWTHTAGFHHDYRRTARRSQSVPYVIGDLVARHAATPGA